MSKPLEEVKGLTIGQLAALVHKIGGLQASERILKEKELARKIATEVAFSKAAPENRFMVHVDYVCPSLDELKEMFGVLCGYVGRVEYYLIDGCRSVSRKPGQVEFQYVHLNYEAHTDDVLIELEKHDLRPALYEELVAFARAFRSEWSVGPAIIALGSVCVAGPLRDRCSAGLHHNMGLFLTPNVDRHYWDPPYRFLAVSK